MDAFGGLRSIQVNTDRIGIPAHRFGDAVGMDSGDGALRTRYPVLQHITHRRTVFEPVHPPAHVGKLRGKDFEQVRADAFARRQIMGVEHELSKTCRRQLLIERQKIARRTSAYVGHLAIEPRDARKQCLQPTRHRIGLGDGSAFLQFEIHHQFEPVGSRKKLIRHRREQRHAAQEQRDCQRDGQPAAIDAQSDQAAKTCVEGGLINRVHVRGLTAGGRAVSGTRARFGPQFFLRQQVVAQQRHRQYGGKPRQQQRQPHHLKQRTGVFPGAARGGRDRQKSGGGNQRARQHRKGRTGIGEGRRAETVVTLIEFNGHHLDGDDGIVHQQAERKNQRAE